MGQLVVNMVFSMVGLAMLAWLASMSVVVLAAVISAGRRREG